MMEHADREGIARWRPDGYDAFSVEEYLQIRRDVSGMRFPVRCTKCSRVYDLAKVTVVARYTDCSVWKCPGCGCTVDDRPPGWGDHHYVELDAEGREKR
jgi:hypothetical protein